jgi:hypothetical protein
VPQTLRVGWKVLACAGLPLMFGASTDLTLLGLEYDGVTLVDPFRLSETDQVWTENEPDEN